MVVPDHNELREGELHRRAGITARIQRTCIGRIVGITNGLPIWSILLFRIIFELGLPQQRPSFHILISVLGILDRARPLVRWRSRCVYMEFTTVNTDQTLYRLDR